MSLFMIDLPQLSSHNFSLNISSNEDATIDDVLKAYLELLTDEPIELEPSKIESILSCIVRKSVSTSALLKELSFDKVNSDDAIYLMYKPEFITEEIMERLDGAKPEIYGVIEDLMDSIKTTGIETDEQNIELLAKYVLASLLFSED